jgi:hypothetical protein
VALTIDEIFWDSGLHPLKGGEASSLLLLLSKKINAKLLIAFAFI